MTCSSICVGSAGVAAVRLRRSFLGYELKFEHFASALHYISQQVIESSEVHDFEAQAEMVSQVYTIP